jgi:uncharacterized phage protein gp47/JayE
MPSQSDIVEKMITSLRASEPDLDTSIGTPLRKILDAVAESVSEAYVDQHLITYQYDIDSKVEGDLDDFVALFGFSRIPAQRAQGVVTFSRPSDTTSAAQAVLITPGTQVMALTNPVVYVQTTVSAVMNPGQLTVDIPVQAITAGSQGNVAAGLLVNIVQVGGTVNGVVNATPLSGGAPQESDAQLRERFKATVFRSLAGTSAMYEGVALEIPQDPLFPDTRAISKVNVLGSSKRWREQIQIVSGTATSTIKGAAYIFADNVFCGVDIDGGSLLTSGVNYTFTPSNPTNRADATATITALGGMPDGLYDLDFEYVPQASRNDPGNTRFTGGTNSGGINNRVDVWCNGQVLDTATQSVVFQNTKTFSSTLTSLYYNTRFTQEYSDGTPNPPVGNIFIPLAYGPIISVPSTIAISGVTYTLGTDYWVVHQNDCFGYGSNSLYGLSWQTARRPANGATFSLTYSYNKVARLVQDAITQWRLVGTDAKAHCGKRVLLKFNLAIVYDRRYDNSVVNTQINSDLSDFLDNLGFDTSVQVSDILQVVHNVPGVDNVRFLTSTDNATNYAIGRMSAYQVNTLISTYNASGRAVDIMFNDDQYPVFHSTNIVQKAPNTFGVG